MTPRFFHMAIALTVAVGLASSSIAETRRATVYRSLCDASTGVALGSSHFAVADDDRNVLRIFEKGAPIPFEPEDPTSVRDFLKTEDGKNSDLEGAARIGNRIYWISSHGRNSEGDVQKRRYRFFATDIEAGSPPSSSRSRHRTRTCSRTSRTISPRPRGAGS